MMFNLCRLAILVLCAVAASGCELVFAGGAIWALTHDSGGEPNAAPFYGALPPVEDLATVGPATALPITVTTQGRGNYSQHMDRIQKAYALIQDVTTRGTLAVDGNTATWETVPGMTEVSVLRFTVRKVGPAAWDYALTGKDKTARDSDALVIIAGHTERGEEEIAGNLTMDWDALNTLPASLMQAPLTGAQPMNGTMEVTFSRNSETHSVDMALSATVGANLDTVADSTVHYTQTVGLGGELTQRQTYDRPVPAADGWNTARIRWDAAGAGRRDEIGGSTGDGQGMTRSNCWDATLQEVFSAYDGPSGIADKRVVQTSGNAGACVFGTAAFYMP